MRKFILSSLILIYTLPGQAQPARTSYGEYGLGVSTLNLTSELSNSGNIDALFKEMRPMVTGFAKYHFNDWLGTGVELSYGRLAASDFNHGNSDRGLSVNTNLYTSYAFAEAHFIRFGKFRRKRKFTLYVTAGAGIAAWNPTVTIPRRVPEDVQFETDAHTAFSYFTGAGVKFRLSYKSILTVAGRFYNSGGDNVDGVILPEEQQTPENDRFWGIMASYSIMIF